MIKYFKIINIYSITLSLFKIGMNSFSVGLSNFLMSLSMIIYYYYPSTWFLDSIFGLIIGLFIFSYAIRLFFSNLF
jgi:hypothetical protein